MNTEYYWLFIVCKVAVLQRGFCGISCFIWSGLTSFCMAWPWYAKRQKSFTWLLLSKTPPWHLISSSLQSPEQKSLRISLLHFIPMFAACREQEQRTVSWPECFKLCFFAECYLAPFHRGPPFPGTVYGWGSRDACLEWSSEVYSFKSRFLFTWTYACCANH